MLDTKKFINELIKNGYTHLCVVPCSFVKNLINEAINNPEIEYVPCASEAVACSIASGLKIGNKKPIAICQSSGLTNMGSCITSLLKPYNITFPILSSWRTYNTGDSEIQHQHLATALPELISAYGYNHVVLDQQDISKAISQIAICNASTTIGIIKKDTFSEVTLDDSHQLKMDKYPYRSEFLKKLNDKFKNSNTIMIGTTGNTSREMFTFMPDTDNFYMVGNMGGALSLGVGMALAEKNVIILGGDAEFVMHLGGITTAGRYKKNNLLYILFDNEQNKSTGGQNTYQAHVDYIKIAGASGFCVDKKIISDIENFENAIEMSMKNNRPTFLHVKCNTDQPTPRPPVSVIKREM